MRTDMPVWPADLLPWRVLHSHVVDALGERPALADLPRDLAGLRGAVADGRLGVTGVITADGLAYVVVRRMPDGGAVVPMCTVAARDLALPVEALTSETDRVAMLTATAPDDASALDGWL
jgi:hypothetical protein